MKSTLSLLVAASTLAMLSACGGSDDHEANGVQPIPSQGVSITSANQTAVTQATVTGGLSMSNVETATNAGGSSAAPSAVNARAHALAAVVRRTLAAGLTRRETIASASSHPLAVSSGNESCAVSGSLTTTFNDVDGNQTISAGDILTVQFNQCRDSATSLYNGKAVITMLTVPTAEQITANAEFQSLSAVEGGLTSTISGTLGVAETDTDTQSDIALTVGGAGLAETMASSSYNDVVTLLSGLRLTISDVFAANRTQLTFDGQLQAQSLPGGLVTLATKSPIVLLDADSFPSAGVLQVKGEHGTLLLTVTSNTAVQVQLDANDDGTYESSTSTPWTSLIPQ